MIMKYCNSMTFEDLLHQLTKLSRPYSVFKDFPGPVKWTVFQGPSRPCAYPVTKAYDMQKRTNTN